MSFGVYVHIPYCLQRCTYCDFATYEHSKILPFHEYIQVLHEEIRQKAGAFQTTRLNTLYFGGGTPSLLPSAEIVSVIHELAKSGFTTDRDTEITIEINPATVDEKKLDHYLEAGINRFSVGAQTFNDPLLKSVHREHNAQQTRETLSLLKKRGLNFSFDLLFALPGQSREILQKDLEEVAQFRPAHISPYCLTVPEGHPLSKGRPLESTQVEMFELIQDCLTREGYHQYEISNFSLPGFESRHNSLYWKDQAYWGLGLSAHSYSKTPPYGVRFWNPSNINSYVELIRNNQGRQFQSPTENLPSPNFEVLNAAQSLTDYCHTSLRTSEGLSLNSLQEKFGPPALTLVQGPLLEMKGRGWLEKTGPNWVLTKEGRLLSNQVFAELTFFESEWNQAKA